MGYATDLIYKYMQAVASEEAATERREEVEREVFLNQDIKSDLISRGIYIDGNVLGMAGDGSIYIEEGPVYVHSIKDTPEAEDCHDE